LDAGFALFDTPVGRCAAAWDADGVLLGILLPDADEARLRVRMAISLACSDLL